MVTLGLNLGKILSWHRKVENHPIFDPNYAQENLVSFVETVVLLSFYSVIVALILHFASTVGFIEKETLFWQVVESSTAILMFGAAEKIISSPYWAVGALFITILVTFLLHIAFDVYKARLHPNFQHEFDRFLLKNKKTVKAPI